MASRFRNWLIRREASRAAETERRAASSACVNCPPAGCEAAGETVCTDEAELLTPPADGSELEGSDLEVGGAIAGLTPIETPEMDDRRRRQEEGSPASECDSCR